MNYIYQLGHCPELSLQEISFLTSQNLNSLNADLKSKLALGKESLDCNSLASVVWSAQVLASVPVNGENWNELNENLAIVLDTTKLREIGFFTNFPVSSKSKNEIYEILKSKCKRVSMLIALAPNYGYWKKTKHWYGIIRFNGNFNLIKIESMADQQYWNELEASLPKTDLARGVINLKLAKALLNLTNNTKIWDPFAGQGRIVCVGLKSKKHFFTSDIDKTVLGDLEENFDAAFEYELKNKKPDTVLQLATLDQNFAEDAQKNKTILDASPENMAIVTEGHLGFNPSRMDIKKPKATDESTKIDYLWQGLLAKSKSLGIKEIVGCVPFYPQIKYLPKYTFMKDNGYSLAFEPVEYSRAKSQVGHLVFKLVLE